MSDRPFRDERGFCNHWQAMLDRDAELREERERRRQAAIDAGRTGWEHTERPDRLPKPIYYDTLIPFHTIEHEGIQHMVAKDFNHISRYKGLRQIGHFPFDNEKRFVTLEIPNPIFSQAPYFTYKISHAEQNRLDLLAYKFYGSAQYSWIISYFNEIEDGYTVHEGQEIKILKNFTDLFNKGEMLAPVPPFSLNLGVE